MPPPPKWRKTEPGGEAGGLGRLSYPPPTSCRSKEAGVDAKLKVYRNLYPQVYDYGSLYWAYRNARKGKRNRAEVQQFENLLEDNLIELQNELIWKTYRQSPYREFYVHEPKKRLIMALPFRDRVVQWSIYMTINPHP